MRTGLAVALPAACIAGVVGMLAVLSAPRLLLASLAAAAAMCVVGLVGAWREGGRQ